MPSNAPHSNPRNRPQDAQLLKQQLQELAELKNTFVALVSHELRTPLNLLSGYLNLSLEEIDENPDQAKEYLQEVNKSVQRITRIVQELTDFARLQREKEITHMNPIPLQESYQQTYQLLKPNLEKKNIHLIVRIPDELRKLEYDGESMIILFKNILSNAAKFSPRDADVVIEGSLAGKEALLAFHDQADPIPENKQELIFKDFRQLENYLTRRYEGMGLGLAVARHTARLLGGDIELNVREDGNTFILRLPRLPILDQS